jgi:predicted metal-dependent enzyme (double-stranded beta helix superfamily)
MPNRNKVRRVAIVSAAFLALPAVGWAVELDRSAVIVKTPDQFMWRDPTNTAASNQTILLGNPNKQGLYIYENTFKPFRFGNPHFHANDRFITVIEGAAWKGTGPVVDPVNAVRLPKGSFMIDHALRVHWDGTKDESSAYLIVGYGPAVSTEIARSTGTFDGIDPRSVTTTTPDQIPWKDDGLGRVANLAGDPAKPGLFVQMRTWLKGNFTGPHFHTRDRFITVLSGTWWVGTGYDFDPANLSVPLKPGTFVTNLAKGVHWDGAKEEDATILIVGEGPSTATGIEQDR